MQTERQQDSDRRTDGQTHRRTDRQTEGHADRETGRQAQSISVTAEIDTHKALMITSSLSQGQGILRLHTSSLEQRRVSKRREALSSSSPTRQPRAWPFGPPSSPPTNHRRIRITLQQHAPDRHSTAWKQSLMTPECKTMMQQDAQQQKTATSTTTKTAGQRNKLWTSAGLAALNPKFPPKTTNCPPVG